MTPFCAAVDWGTSSFRLWLLGRDGSVLAERRSDEGMTRAAGIGFGAVLESHLAALGAEAPLPVVICGMAGARQGWREAGYLDTPADLADIAGSAVAIEGERRDIRILGGIAQRKAEAPDVMRGEETQLLGLTAEGIRSAFICMPGTHSKWVKLRDGTVSAFSTYLTGELFAVLAGHSILSAAVDTSAPVAADDPAFLNAVKLATEKPQTIANLLFQIRSGQLLRFAPLAEGAARLSGLLIGVELAGVTARYSRIGGVVLVASGRLAELYRSALEASDIAVRLCDAEEAVRRGLWSAGCALWAPEGGSNHDS